jgi:hypothetical protein
MVLPARATQTEVCATQKTLQHRECKVKSKKRRLRGSGRFYAAIAGHEEHKGAVKEARSYGAKPPQPTASLGSSGICKVSTKHSGLATFFNA